MSDPEATPSGAALTVSPRESCVCAVSRKPQIVAYRRYFSLLPKCRRGPFCETKVEIQRAVRFLLPGWILLR